MQICHHCFEALALETAYPCQQCQLAWYCSAAHRDADSFHCPGSPSCGVPWTALLPERAVLAIRLALISKVCHKPCLQTRRCGASTCLQPAIMLMLDAAVPAIMPAVQLVKTINHPGQIAQGGIS